MTGKVAHPWALGPGVWPWQGCGCLWIPGCSFLSSQTPYLSCLRMLGVSEVENPGSVAWALGVLSSAVLVEGPGCSWGAKVS